MLVDLGDQLAVEQETAGAGTFTSDLLARLPGWQSRAQAALGGKDQEADALTFESFMLAHHAGESLLRHFLAQSVGAAAVDAYLSHAGAWLRHYATWHLETSNGYNAAKHGLSSLPSHARVSFFAQPTPPGDDPTAHRPTEVPMLAGAVLTILEHEGTSASTP